MFLVARMAVIVLLLYAALLGAHFRGILLPEVRLLTLVLLAIVVLIWLLIRRRASWKWHRTALDAALPIWIVAFILSLLLNLDSSRRIVLGLWYMGVYTGLWYLLNDMLANWSQARRALIEGLLFVGVMVLIFSALEWNVAVQARVNPLEYRFSGLFGNPNSLGTFLMVFIVFALGRFAAVRSTIARMGLVACLLLGSLLLLLTDSRSAFIGLGAGLVTWLLLRMRGRFAGLTDLPKLWRAQSRARQMTIVGMLLVVVLVFGAGVIWLAQSFTSGERGLSFRPQLFNAAVQMFIEQPLSGQGIFTFGRHLPRFFSLPPLNVHSHAHNLPIQIAGELGVIGLLAAILTFVLIVRSAWFSGKAQSGVSEREDWSAAVTVSAGYGVIHLLDVTAMMPFLAIVGMIALALASSPPQPQILQRRRGTGIRNFGLAGLWLVLFASGVWDGQSYRRYMGIMGNAVESGAYAETAANLQPLVEVDPTMVVYPSQQAFLWGLAAHAGDADSVQKAITAYERVVALEPYYAPYHANLGALYWTVGNQERGLDAMKRAAALAPRSWQLQYNLGVHAEMLGMTDAAQAAYAQALLADPDADLYPGWGQTPLQQMFSSAFEDRTVSARIVLLLESSDIEGALELWESEYASSSRASDMVLRVLLALAQGNRQEAQDWYERATRAPETVESNEWLQVAEKYMAFADRDTQTAAFVVQQAHSARAYDVMASDYQYGPDFIYYQYFYFIIPRQFLPQVEYPLDRVILLHLLDAV